MVHVLDGTQQAGARFYHDTRKRKQFQTQALFISGIVHLIFQSKADRDSAESRTVGGGLP